MRESKIKPHQKAQTRKEIAAYLGISPTTLWRKLKNEKLSIPPGLVYPSDLKKIYDLLYNESK